MTSPEVALKTETERKPSPSIFKKISRSLQVAVIGTLGAFILYCLNRTVKWEVHMFDNQEFQDWEIPEPAILSFWHQRELMVSFLYLDYIRKRISKPMYTIISKHHDGRIIACAMRWLKIHSVSGSSTRGGKKALTELIEKVNDGYGAGIMPDGPQGPIFEAKFGVVKLAQQTGRPVVPVAFSASKTWQFKSWDKMMLPKPFSKGVYYIGAPISVPTDTDDSEVEGFLRKIEAGMTDALENADRIVKN